MTSSGFRSLVVLAAASFSLTTTLAGCFGSEAEPTGTLSVNLVGQGASGSTYRLRDATITVQGPASTQVWNTEDNPDRASLMANVVVGDYTSLLAPGWRLERVVGQTATPVTAELASPNPSTFSVVEDQLTYVPLRFRSSAEDIDMSQGYEIVLVVCATQESACGDGFDNDCDGAFDCSDSDCTGAPACGVCGNGILEGNEQCDDGNTASLDGCSAACALEPSEVEPNEDGSPSTGGTDIFGNDFSSANANGVFTGDLTLVGHLVPAGDEDVFAFQNPAQLMTQVRFDLWSSALGIGVPCGPGSIGTGLVIRDALGTILAFNDDRNGALDRCSGLDFTLAPGQRVYAQVTDYGDNNAIQNYVLVANYVSTCGDGVLEGDEQCDDGNGDYGDGCSALCQLEDDLEIEPNNTILQATASARQITHSTDIEGSLDPADDLDLFRVTVGEPRVVRFDTYTSHFQACTSPLRVRLLDATGASVADSSTASLPCGALALFVNAGTYFVAVDSPGAGASVPRYLLAVQYQGDQGVESEPAGASGGNDTIATASTNLVFSSHVFVLGDKTSTADADVFAISVPPGARIRAEIIEGDRAAETCESNDIDSLLTLLDENGVALAIDDDDGRGFCSLIDGISAPPQDSAAGNATGSDKTYYLRVEHSSLAAGTQRQFKYRLQLTIQ